MTSELICTLLRFSESTVPNFWLFFLLLFLCFQPFLHIKNCRGAQIFEICAVDFFFCDLGRKFPQIVNMQAFF